MSATSSLLRFNSVWCSQSYPPEKISEQEITAAEGRLKTKLPDDYRSAILEIGLPRPTSALLDTIVDRNLDLQAFGDLLTPAEIVSTTEAWREMGMGEDMIAFASDGMGSLFCFPAQNVRSSVLPVFFFDHDLGTTERVGSSFVAWIDSYSGLEAH